MYGQFSVHPKAIALMDDTDCRVSVPSDYEQENLTYSGYKKYQTQNFLMRVTALGLVLSMVRMVVEQFTEKSLKIRCFINPTVHC